MALERPLRTGTRTRINWRVTPERLLIKLGLADPETQRTASDDAVQRSLIAVDDARLLRDLDPAPRTLRRAQRRLRSAMRQATVDGGLVPFQGRDRRDVLLDHIAVLRGTSALLDIDVPTPWAVSAEKRVGEQRTLEVRSHAQHDTSVDHSTSITETTPHGNVTDVVVAESGSSVTPGVDAGQSTVAASVDLPGSSAGEVVSWAQVAELVCADDPARRRCPNEVETILGLHHLERQTYPQITRQFDGLSEHAVGRVVWQARKYRHPAYPAPARRRYGTTATGGPP